MFLLIKCPPKANSESGQTLYKHSIVEKVVLLAVVFTQSDFKLVLWLISTYADADRTKTFPTCSYLAAGWSLKFAVTVPFPACWWTENSPEALSLSEMCGLGPDEKQKQRINSQKSVFRWQVHWQLLTFASTTWSLRVCSAVCVSRFVPISSIVAVWLWTTCDCMLATSRLLFFWRKFSNCTQRKGNTRCQSLLYERKMRSKTLKTQETQRNPSSAHPVITAESSTQNQTDRLQTKRF